jgi:hypothetical protein
MAVQYGELCKSVLTVFEQKLDSLRVLEACVYAYCICSCVSDFLIICS